LLQRLCLRSIDEAPVKRFNRAFELALDVTCLSDPTAPFPVSASVARFVDRLAGLSTDEWGSIQEVINKSGVEVTVLEASRNAAVALAVRDLISHDQFEHLYEPFALAIPTESLEPPLKLD
jgi:hypothetical protein